MDQATVLEEPVKHVKHQSSKTTTDPDTESCSNDENFTDEPQPLPQIEAKLSGRNVLIRILCVNCKGVLATVVKEIEKLYLRVDSSNGTPFGTSIAISVVAQMDAEFKMTVKDLEECLRSSLIQFNDENLPQ